VRDVYLVRHDDDGFRALADAAGQRLAVLVGPLHRVVGVVERPEDGGHLVLARAEPSHHLGDGLLDVEAGRAGLALDGLPVVSDDARQPEVHLRLHEVDVLDRVVAPGSTGSPSAFVAPAASTTLTMTSAFVSSSRNWLPRPRPSWAPGTRPATSSSSTGT